MKALQLLMYSVVILTWTGVDLAIGVQIRHNGSDVFSSGGFENDIVDTLPASPDLGTSWLHRADDAQGQREHPWRIEEWQQIAKESLLNCLPAVIAKTEMHSCLSARARKHLIDSRCRNFGVLWATG